MKGRLGTGHDIGERPAPGGWRGQGWKPPCSPDGHGRPHRLANDDLDEVSCPWVLLGRRSTSSARSSTRERTLSTRRIYCPGRPGARSGRPEPSPPVAEPSFFWYRFLSPFLRDGVFPSPGPMTRRREHPCPHGTLLPIVLPAEVLRKVISPHAPDHEEDENQASLPVRGPPSLPERDDRPQGRNGSKKRVRKSGLRQGQKKGAEKERTQVRQKRDVGASASVRNASPQRTTRFAPKVSPGRCEEQPFRRRLHPPPSKPVRPR